MQGGSGVTLRVIWITMVTAGLCQCIAAHAQTLPLSNPSFELGDKTPKHWELSGETGGLLEGDAPDGNRAITVTGTGDDSVHWGARMAGLEPSRLYALTFHAKRLEGTGGTVVSGPEFCNRDIRGVPGEWTAYTSYFQTRARLEAIAPMLRLGQWHLKGTVAFDAVKLTRALAVHSKQHGIRLGEGESIQGNTYRFSAPLNTLRSNYSRPLARHTSGFNSNRWVFGPGEEVVYRHDVAGRTQQQAEVRINVNHYNRGTLIVEASSDGEDWKELGTTDGAGGVTYELPSSLLPAETVWVRMRTAPNEPAYLQVDTFSYEAAITGETLDFAGATQLLQVPVRDQRLTVSVKNMATGRPGSGDGLVLDVASQLDGTRPVTAELQVHTEGHDPPTAASTKVELEPGANRISIPLALKYPGENHVRCTLRGESVLFQAEADVHVAHLHAAHYGELLEASEQGVALWRASSGWKVSRSRPVPQESARTLEVSAARNESEAMQLVVRPEKHLHNVQIEVTDLRNSTGAKIPSNQIDILRVGYVHITQPTDTIGVRGYWPDPLLPVDALLTLEADQNHPFWVRVHVPAGVDDGVYKSEIRLTAEGYEAAVPLELHVFDFTLPERMTCETALGFNPGQVFRYQGITGEANKRAVLDKYWESFERHHISPYDPAPLDRFEVSWPKPENALAEVPEFDWSAWDKEMERVYKERNFNTFRVSIAGMGGGSFLGRNEPELLGFGEDTPEYKALFQAYCQEVESHLREHGLLDDAYVYWFDEPAPQDYEFVMNGFEKLKAAAPGLRRMLTEQVEPELIGGPNLWCPITYEFDLESAQKRMAKGEAFWWYVCTGPKAPYPGLFIDHPGTELRVWLWQTWKRRIKGILVWQTVYWTSRTAYPDSLQNPYKDPMSWRVAYGDAEMAPGTRSPWGNGDGRFLYPPLEAADGNSDAPVLKGPVESIRWEMLRDGIEDYEYFAILNEIIDANQAELTGAERAELERLLEVPEAVSSNSTAFTKDPSNIEVHRIKLGRAIERWSSKQ